jgi:hypothetical protein
MDAMRVKGKGTTEMDVCVKLSEAAAFFYANAGSSYIPAIETEPEGRLRIALDLARAEHMITVRGASVQWEIDHDADTMPTGSYFVSGNPQWEAVLYDADGEVAGSLCGIDFAEAYEVTPESDPYARVVAAELASEYL